MAEPHSAHSLARGLAKDAEAVYFNEVRRPASVPRRNRRDTLSGFLRSSTSGKNRLKEDPERLAPLSICTDGTREAAWRRHPSTTVCGPRRPGLERGQDTAPHPAEPPRHQNARPPHCYAAPRQEPGLRRRQQGQGEESNRNLRGTGRENGRSQRQPTGRYRTVPGAAPQAERREATLSQNSCSRASESRAPHPREGPRAPAALASPCKTVPSPCACVVRRGERPRRGGPGSRRPAGLCGSCCRARDHGVLHECGRAETPSDKP